MIAAYRKSIAVFFALASLAGLPAVASQLRDDDGTDRILIADPSPALRAYLSGSGFGVESLELLEALGLSLMTATPPDRVPARAALRDLRARFPAAIVALDDRFHLARDVRSVRAATAQLRQVLTAIAWPSSERSGADDGIRVGVIDSSLDAAHPALRDAAIVQRQFTSGKPPAMDTAHGTAMAAMLVGRSNERSVSGLLRGATLFYAGIFQNGRHGPLASSADFLRGINWLVRSGVTVINASVTSTSKNAVVFYAMSLLPERKVALVAAAGNLGPFAPPVYPAAIPSAFAVTAVSIKGSAYRHANTGDYIDIAAPGINVPTTSPEITTGTSLAVPFVTAALAHMIAVCGISPTQAQAKLQTDARDLGPKGWDPYFGWGLLQALPDCAEPGVKGLTIGLGASPSEHHPLLRPLNSYSSTR